MDQQIAAHIKKLKELQVRNDRNDGTQVQNIFESLYALRKEKRELFTEQTLDAIEDLAINCPDPDADIDNAQNFTPETLAHYICDQARGFLRFDLKRVEEIALRSQILRVRKEAILDIYGLIDPRTPEKSVDAIAALARQGRENSNPHLRACALSYLYSLGRENERENDKSECSPLFDVAIEVLIGATDDPHPATRRKALGQLTNAVMTGPAREESSILSLLPVFAKAAERPGADAAEVKQAKQGVDFIRQRREQGPGWWKKKCEAEEKARNNRPGQG